MAVISIEPGILNNTVIRAGTVTEGDIVLAGRKTEDLRK